MKYIFLFLLLASCSTRKVVVQDVKKDSLSQVYTKLETKEDLRIENNVVVDEFTITPLDTCKDIIIDGKVYKNVVLTYKKTKDNTIHTQKKITSKKEDKKIVVKEKQKAKEVKRTSFNFVWIVLIVVIIVIWLNKQYLVSLLRKI
jgi:hypothetical protein